MKFLTGVDGIHKERKWPFSILSVLWVVGAFALSTLLVGLILLIFHINEDTYDANLFVTVTSAAIYAVLLGLTLGAPRLFKLWSGRINYRKLLGLTRLLQWRDILYAAVGFAIYLALATALALIVQALIPGFNATQAQDTGFSKTLTPANALLVFVTLVIVAPVAEEIIFRGYLFGTLRRSVPVWVAILVTSVTFGAVHLQWNVGLDVGVMSLVSCVLRLKSGSLWPSILLHMAKNGLAFYVLYVATSAIM